MAITRIPSGGPGGSGTPGSGGAGEGSFSETMEITGSAAGAGTEWASDLLFDSAEIEGVLESITIRRDAADAISTSVTPYAVDKGATLAAAPADDDKVFEAASIALTASATDADLDTDFDKPRRFVGGLRVGGAIVVSGAGTYRLHITVRGYRTR